jgi:hypothetical protein
MTDFFHNFSVTFIKPIAAEAFWPQSVPGCCNLVLKIKHTSVQKLYSISIPYILGPENHSVKSDASQHKFNYSPHTVFHVDLSNKLLLKRHKKVHN